MVLTHLLNAVPDPQRRQHIGADSAVLDVLADSIRAHGRHLVVLTDCLGPMSADGITYERVPPGGNPYFYRHRLTADYLEAHPGIERVWCVDGTDVEMLNDPFPHMTPGTVYVGSEPSVIGGRAGPWLNQHGRSAVHWMAEHGDRVVVNVGLIGGDRADVQAMTAELAAREALGDDYEMGTFQQLIHTDYPDHVTGPLVHTVFRALDRDSPAWWRHK